eukprot:TRINITY_DN2849_c3_g2_i1.p1 TRINITY_DN2849_c3_g2~~TRINITY_DN2849_c3_g2_i1.p1  ORF type:complete len:349 (+),score=48.51 TRINITY_DN2849_c3_g2_i1:81-1127(+)
MEHSVSRYTLGLILIVLVAFIWVGASELIKGEILTETGPVFLTYFNTVGFSLWLLGGLCVEEWRTEVKKWREYSKPVWLFTPVWFLANVTFNASLKQTSVASSGILSNTAALWTYILSVVILKDPITTNGVIALLFTSAGAVCVALSDDKQESGSSASTETVFGDVLCLVSAFCYAIYTLLLRVYMPEHLKMPVFFGFVGVSVLVVGTPIALIFILTGVEPFSLSPKLLLMLGVNSLVGTNLSDVLWARSVLLTSPTVAALGLSLTIPIGLVADMFLHGSTYTAQYISGALLVLVGFVVINVKRNTNAEENPSTHIQHNSDCSCEEDEEDAEEEEEIEHEQSSPIVHI